MSESISGFIDLFTIFNRLKLIGKYPPFARRAIDKYNLKEGIDYRITKRKSDTGAKPTMVFFVSKIYTDMIYLDKRKILDKRQKPLPLKLIKDLGKLYANEHSKKKEHYGIFECKKCGNHFKTLFKSVRHDVISGCKGCGYLSEQHIKHGMTKTRLYRAWSAMKQRCMNSNTEKYDRYGGRGIKICGEWVEDFVAFKNWALSNGYKDSLEIDRIDNDGDYEPNNCRWVSRAIQARNTTRIRADNSTGYRGIECKTNGKASARITVGGKRITIGTFDTKYEAGKAYDNYVIDNNLEHTTNGIIIKGEVA